ncbi:hypothetical protein B0A67_24425 [Flavobacterium aquidurense]|jgi:hypothetical protein|nr:hypothetical protein B0A67_24425 [Flavobacterium aquidurense]SHH86498.1 hypothetical protein SAMN05444481_1364 [Flavobacterium frigidimaris]
MLKTLRKELKINIKELDSFIKSKQLSTKYYLENSYRTNKLFRYLLFLRMKGVDLNKFFDDEINDNDTNK